MQALSKISPFYFPRSTAVLFKTEDKFLFSSLSITAAVWVTNSEREREVKPEDSILEACPSKVCTVEAFEGVSAHHAPKQRIALPHAAPRSHLPCVCSGAPRLPLAYSNTACDNQPAETWFRCSCTDVCVCGCLYVCKLSIASIALYLSCLKPQTQTLLCAHG